LSFPEVDNIKVSEALFEKINYDRKSEPYQRAIQIAKLLLLNYRPDLIAGSYNSIAILFNMNQLWEEYIYRMLLKAKPKGVEIYNQKSIRFWQSGLNVRTIRPDIIIKSPIGKIVIDTKWKNLHNNLSKISMDDLRQMYTYHDYFEANDCYLIYPGDELSVLNGTFNDRYFFSNIKQTRKHCGVILGRAWINEISGRSFLDKSLGNQIFDSLFKQ
jgi:5-methylcytosine-specific restriction enzyme subunit McrC